MPRIIQETKIMLFSDRPYNPVLVVRVGTEGGDREIGSGICGVRSSLTQLQGLGRRRGDNDQVWMKREKFWSCEAAIAGVEKDCREYSQVADLRATAVDN